MLHGCRILLVSGSLRRASTNTAVLRTAIATAPDGVIVQFYDDVAALAAFNPDDEEASLPAAAANLREQVRAADALLFSVPEYAGGLPGAFKNLLDWLIGDDQPGSIYEKPVAWINASVRGAVNADASLRLVLSYAHANDRRQRVRARSGQRGCPRRLGPRHRRHGLATHHRSCSDAGGPRRAHARGHRLTNPQ